MSTAAVKGRTAKSINGIPVREGAGERRAAGAEARGAVLAAPASIAGFRREFGGENAARSVCVQLRELMAWMFKQRRDKTIRDVFVYLVWFLMYSAVVAMVLDIHNAWTASTAISEGLADEEIRGASFKKNFFEVATRGEVFEWLEGPVLDGLWPASGVQSLSRFGLVGGVRFRQVRVRPDTCESQRAGGPQARWTCYPDIQFGVNDARSPMEQPRWWSADLADQVESEEVPRAFFDRCNATHLAAEGEVGEEEAAGADEVPRWAREAVGGLEWWAGAVDRPGADLQALNASRTYVLSRWSEGTVIDALYGWEPSSATTYGPGSYDVLLPRRSRRGAECLLLYLKRGEWLDRGTRALVMETALYNEATGLLFAVRMSLFVFPTGSMARAVRVYPMPVEPYMGVRGRWRMAIEVIFSALTVWYIWRLGRRACKAPRPSLFWWNLEHVVELLVLGSVVVAMGTWAFFYTTLTFDANGTQFVDYFPQAEYCVTMLTFAGCTQLAMLLRLLQLLRINRRVHILCGALTLAATDLVAFAAAIIVLGFGFAWLGQLTFGPYLAAFKSFGWSLATVMRWPLGDFDYAALGRAQPLFAATYFFIFVVVFFLVFLNLVLAIVSNSFAALHQDVRRAERWKAAAPALEAEVAHFAFLYARQCRRRLFGLVGINVDDPRSSPPKDVSNSTRSLILADFPSLRASTPPGTSKAATASHAPPTAHALGQGLSAPRSIVTQSDAGRADGADGAGAAAGAAGGVDGRGGAEDDAGEASASAPVSGLGNGSSAGTGTGRSRRLPRLRRASTPTGMGSLRGIRMSVVMNLSTAILQRDGDLEQIEEWQRETAFQVALAECMKDALSTHGVDLFEHLEAVYLANGENPALCISWLELVALTCDTEAIAEARAKGADGWMGDVDDKGMVALDELPATRVFRYMHASLKDTYIVPRSSVFERRRDEVTRAQLPVFHVAKITVTGQRKAREVVIDAERGEICMFQRGWLVRREIPFTQIVQFEQHRAQPRQLEIVTTAEGMDQEDERVLGKAEARHRIEFSSHHRVIEFMDQFQRAHALFRRRLERARHAVTHRGLVGPEAEFHSSLQQTHARRTFRIRGAQGVTSKTTTDRSHEDSVSQRFAAAQRTFLNAT